MKNPFEQREISSSFVQVECIHLNRSAVLGHNPLNLQIIPLLEKASCLPEMIGFVNSNWETFPSFQQNKLEVKGLFLYS